MADNCKDVIITDAEFLNAAGQCKQYCTKLQAVLKAYQDIMNSLVTFGIKDLSITSNIKIINFELMKYPSMLEESGIEINRLIKKYIVDIDNIDTFKY